MKSPIKFKALYKSKEEGNALFYHSLLCTYNKVFTVCFIAFCISSLCDCDYFIWMLPLCKINCAAASNRISRKGKQLGFIFILSLMTQLAWVHYSFSEPKSCFPHFFPPSPSDYPHRQGFPSLSFLLCWVTFCPRCAASLPLMPRKTLTDMTGWDHLYKFYTHALHSIERGDLSLYEGSAEGKEENKWEYLEEGKMIAPWAKYSYPLTVVDNAS